MKQPGELDLRYEFTDAGYKIASRNRSGEATWEALHGWFEGPSILALQTSQQVYEVIPKRAFVRGGSHGLADGAATAHPRTCQSRLPLRPLPLAHPLGHPDPALLHFLIDVLETPLKGREQGPRSLNPS